MKAKEFKIFDAIKKAIKLGKSYEKQLILKYPLLKNYYSNSNDFLNILLISYIIY